MGRQTKWRNLGRNETGFPSPDGSHIVTNLCAFKKEEAGTLNTQDCAFHKALLKRGFPKTSGAKLIIYHQLAKHNNNLQNQGPD